MKWTDEMVAEMQRLVAERLTLKAIAGRMGVTFGIPFTRNQIAGACARRGIKLPRDPRPPKPALPKPPQALRVVAPRRKLSSKMRKQVERTATADLSVMLGPKNDFPARGRCQWIEGEPGHTEWRCCARPVYEGTFYCAGHLARTSTPARPYTQIKLERLIDKKAPVLLFKNNIARFERAH